MIAPEGSGELKRVDLAGAAHHRLEASGVFQFVDAVYSVIFRTEQGLAKCLDLVLNYPQNDPAVARLHLKSDVLQWPSCTLRFHFNAEHLVAAAGLTAMDKDDRRYSWMTRGDAGRNDVVLAHDTWNPGETRFPSESFITIPELRQAVGQWAFGDSLPPPAVRWTVAPELGWF